MKPVLLAAALAASIAAQAQSPYAGQESRDIKALSSQEVSDYLAGKGMGLAKAAELNGYPGPAHVLEMAGPLALSAEQRAATEALFKRMQESAVAPGRQLVEEERALDRMFAAHAVDDAKLAASLERIGALSARVREAHLHAHLEQAALLSKEQIAKYNELRGYSATESAHMGHAHH